MAHLSAEHIIDRRHVARKVNPPDIGSFTGVDEELHDHGAVVLVNLRHARHFGEVVSLIAESPGEVVLRGGNQLLRIHLIGLNDQKTIQVLFRKHEITTQTHFADGELLTLGHVGSDVHLFLVRRNRNLGRVNVELQVTAIQIVGRQGLQIGCQFFFGVLVIAGEE